MDFTPEADDEVIREVVLQTFDRPLVNTPNKVCRDSTQTKSPISPFHIGDSLRYKNYGHNDMLDMVDVNKMISISFYLHPPSKQIWRA